MIKDFEGKVAVITGGASGIGRGFAHAFAKRGMKIVLADIDKENLDMVSQELQEIGTEVLTVIIDVSNPEQVAHLADVSYEYFGSVNILCNNAGVGGGGPIRFMTLENWDWTLGVNLFGVIYGIKFFLDRMIKSKEPCHIVNTSSLAGLVTGEGQPYSASKHAVVAISESLALECFNTNVGVSVVCPGFVRTNIMKNYEILRQSRPGLWQPTPEMVKLSETARENLAKILELGMDPEHMAEIVIKAIENNILFVVTHPEYIPAMKSRFERIYDDTFKLHDGFEENQEVKSSIYNHDTPAFSVTYPENFIELQPGPMSKAIFVASNLFVDLIINVSKISPKKRLEQTTKKIVRILKPNTREIKIISNNLIKLRDGTPAYESIIEYKAAGMIKVKSIHLSVIKDEKWIRISIYTGPNLFDDEKFKRILYSLELKK
ncbi:MAG: SDR family NAD(P)-dependent oxidoreductase [Promethearchaeota archaeon]|jgi:NAD(P)-dependent dehydrogenase (short-subunit alcohol dehydrogenase family)